jgi:hypothetical protein
VCAFGCAYIVADDERFLARFRDFNSPGEVLDLGGDPLPENDVQRKKIKPDFETLFLLPSLTKANTTSRLIALGSGSGLHRNHGVCVTIDENGAWNGAPSFFDLMPLYRELKRALGDLNIEGSFVQQHSMSNQAQWVLINRAVQGKSPNAAIYLPADSLWNAIEGKHERPKHFDICEFNLGHLDEVGLGFTDATPLDDGGWLFSAAAENRPDSYTDGICTGSVVGRVSPSRELMEIKRLDKRVKVEGLAVQPNTAPLNLCMVTDADDTTAASQMLMAKF